MIISGADHRQQLRNRESFLLISQNLKVCYVLFIDKAILA